MVDDELVPDHDVQLLRRFRRRDAAVDERLCARLEGELWEHVLAEEARLRGGRRRRRGIAARLDGLLRPVLATGAAATLALGIFVWSDLRPAPPAGSTESTGSAATFDATAAGLFGGSSASAARAPVGSVDMREDTLRRAVAAGPHAPGALAAAARLPRDPHDLAAVVSSAAGDAASSEADADRIAFHLAMRWVVDPSVPGDVRAAFVRSLQSLSGVDQATAGNDVLGRPGIVIGHLDVDSGLREQYVVRREGGLLLERRAFTTAYVDPACPPGTFVDHALFEDGRQVLRADVPWMDWPRPVVACDPASGPAGLSSVG